MTAHLDHEETAPENKESMRMIYAGHRLSSFLVTRRDQKLLDIGCNSGFLATHLIDPYGTIYYTGIDPDAGLITKAKTRGLPLTRFIFHGGQADEIPYRDGNFDAFYMGEVLEHLERPHKAIGEAFRVLKHGGFGIITTPLKIEAYSFELGRFKGHSSHHKQEFDIREMEEMLKIPGIKIEGISLVSQNPTRWFRLVMIVEVTKE